MTVAPASAASGYYARQLAQSEKATVSSSVATTRAVTTAVSEQTSKSVEVREKTSRRLKALEGKLADFCVEKISQAKVLYASKSEMKS